MSSEWRVRSRRSRPIGAVDPARARARLAPHERQVAPLDAPLADRRGEPRVRLLRARDERAGRTCRGRAGGRCPGRSGSPPAAPSASRPCASVVALLRPRRVHDEPGGLVDDEQVLVLEARRRARARPARATRSSGTSTSSSSPPASRWLFGRRSPSTRTAPAATSRSASARDPDLGQRGEDGVEAPSGVGVRNARAVSVPTRGARAVGRDEREEEEPDADDDERVREVERRPVVEVEEVGHVAEPEPVDEVRGAAAEHEPDRGGQQRMPSGRSGRRTPSARRSRRR